MDYLSKTPYIAPPFEEMEHYLMGGTTPAQYKASVSNLTGLKGVAVSAISYASDELAVTGIEVLPELQPGEKIPLMIYNRGGSGDVGKLSPGQVTALMAPFAITSRMGVLASNYRGNGDSEGREEFGGADVQDVLQLIAVGKAQPWWDGKNIFMLGWSRGGMMAYLALKAGAPVTAAAVGAGITDLAQMLVHQDDMEDLCTRRIPDFASTREAAIHARSAVCWPEEIHAPLLILHGDADTRVDVQQARDLVAKLTALDAPVRYIEYPGGDHALRREWLKWIAEIQNWFAEHRR